ncbi:MAG: DUF4293 domain-containing protein [Salibacteraceae bacterium]|jgi:amino acid permease|nr:DUF4293 domain-containing protein [Salibacteraceae bacterium]MDP4686316.1 DUF4293 domain-containing protein [Salibacteraceae bacterium]MDP4762954.1 DUF4293 domain-containing protein [Salibacteraceae bacterium]MDP4844454.1 DUF4293 domain-containing protein [Salibacteraceae bacterium]MDP4965516.1 DUF4293 domain-containing protein [Salibacteraceae bacterium]
MIQRIQSLYLAAATLLTLLLLFLPWVTYQTETTSMAFDVLHGNENGLNAIYLLPSVLITTGLSMAAIFLFKDRKKQMKYVRFAMIFAVVIFLNFGLLHFVNIQNLTAVGKLQMSYGIPAALLLVNLVLYWLANKAIKKDDDLVRSVDRLR